MTTKLQIQVLQAQWDDIPPDLEYVNDEVEWREIPPEPCYQP
jgi:hypothetical protein